MIRSYLFAGTALLSVAGVLALAEPVHAQRVGVSVGVGRGYGGYGGYPSAGYYRGYGYPGIYYGLPRGMDLYPYRPGYYNAPNYFPQYPQYPQQQQGRTAYYYAPSVTALPVLPVYAAARLQVLVPVANAQVWIGDHKTTATGTTRYFDSPPLDPSKSYSYTLKAEWQQDGKPVSVERTVTVRAGSQSVVDLMLP